MTSPRQALRRLGRVPAKRLGQHFLIHQATAERIAASIDPGPGDVVVEIGGGLGALTAPLSRSGARVIAVEIDAELAAFLRQELLAEAPEESLAILCIDILQLDLGELYHRFQRKLKIIGNLPYNISSPVLFKLMESGQCLERAVLMLQDEVAERLLAEPGSRDHGILSVMMAYHCERRRLMRVRASQFYPPPKVDSTVVSLILRPWPEPPRVEPNWLLRVVKAAFAYRRKTLKNSLLTGDLPGLSPEVLETILQEAEIESRRRPESLTVQEYLRLAEGLGQRGTRNAERGMRRREI
jgi:16S rRNA (adenine1518-N6/adenine1519-N6)-dimethyltransferase